MRLLGALLLAIGCGVPAVGALAATFVVTHGNDAGPGSLRAAIVAANGDPDTPHRIEFDIPGAGLHSIRPQSPLPFVTRSGVAIDGFSQPGSRPNGLDVGSDAIHTIELDGSALAFEESVGLVFLAGQGEVRGLVLNRFVVGVMLHGDGSHLHGNLIGLAAGGEVAHLPMDRDGDGLVDLEVAVALIGPGGHRLGGPSAAERNVLLGRVSSAVLVPGGSGHEIQNNYIGMNAAGDAALGAGTFGGSEVGIDGIAIAAEAVDLLIGGGTGAGNVIAGLARNGIRLQGLAGSTGGHRIEGNLIGWSADASAVLGTGLSASGVFHGVHATEVSALTLIGNRIAGARGYGIAVEGSASTPAQDIAVLDNELTLNGAGGGDGERGGLLMRSVGAADIGGNRVLSNAGSGIDLDLAGGLQIIDNEVADNLITGIALSGRSKTPLLPSSIRDNRIAGNWVGVGIEDASDIEITANEIRDHAGFGILVDGFGTRGITLSANRIAASGVLGIKLGDGQLPLSNDPDDLDSGANGLQNHPVLFSAVTVNGQLRIVAQLDIPPLALGEISTDYRVEFFASPQCHPAGHGEGEQFLGAVVPTLRGGFRGELFVALLDVLPAAGQVLTATATHLPSGNSSEFSACVALQADGNLVFASGFEL